MSSRIGPRIVATYTTIPGRYESLKQSILTLKEQSYPLDAIYVGIPKICRRTQKPYPPIPDDLRSLCTIVDCDQDYGPLTKIYGGLISESDPNTVLISCDDDVLFPEDFIKSLMNHHDGQNVICGTGALIKHGLLFISIFSSLDVCRPFNFITGPKCGTKGRPIDLVFGVGGVLYSRKHFPKNEDLHEELLKYALLDNDLFHNDDVVISGYLSKRGITRMLYNDIIQIHNLSGADALSADLWGMLKRMNRAIIAAETYGLYTKENYESLTYNEILVLNSLFWFCSLVLLIILVVIFCYCMYRYVHG